MANICEKCTHRNVCRYQEPCEECNQFAVEVVHAEWLDGDGYWLGKKVYDSIDCSHCEEIFKIESHDREYWKKRFKVCPFCGAVMDGERKDNG